MDEDTGIVWLDEDFGPGSLGAGSATFRRRMMPASARSVAFTSAELGKAFATSGSSATMFVPCA